MSSKTRSLNESRVQNFVVTTPTTNNEKGDWPVDLLAFNPSTLEALRVNRPNVLDALSDDASSMLELVLRAPPPDPGMALVDGETVLEVVIGADERVPAWWLELGAERARTICKIDASGIDYLNRNGSWFGTGFLVAPGILCTNHHVLNSREVATQARALFDFAARPDGSVRNASSFRLRPDLLFWTTPTTDQGGLDVTFVAIEGDPGKTYGFTPLHRQSFGAGSGSPLNIIQHPAGRVKEASLRENKLVWQDPKVVHYEADTEGGSSGSPVFNDLWELIAVHHAAKDRVVEGKKMYLNEGIKLSAVAAALELAGYQGDLSASKVLAEFGGTDELVGYFGTAGRTTKGNEALERVVNVYKGEAQDLDVGFWNVEWFNKRWEEKLDAVARIVIEMNLDVWVFVESSKEATLELAMHLKKNYGVEFGVEASQDSPSSLQITTVMWNTKMVSVSPQSWPERIHRWFLADSRDFEDLDLPESTRLEAVDGKIFDRYPALFKVAAQLEGKTFELNLVPLHLKAMAEGSKRRQLASRLLVAAVAEASGTFPGEWMLGGDFNASLDSGDFDALVEGGLIPLSAADAEEGQITYVKRPYLSLIDHVFVSSNLTPAQPDYVIVAVDQTVDRFLDVSDHRPILVRLSGGGGLIEAPERRRGSDPNGLTPEERRRIAAGLQRSTPRRVEGQQDYYDATADARARQAYWGDIGPNFADVSAHLASTHTNELSYQPSKHLYPLVDLQPNGMLRSVYSGVEVTPETYIRADAEVDRKRLELRRSLEAGRLESYGLEAAQLEAFIEESLPYNCEHVVPQSWFSKKQPMRGDLHHLFSCEPRCNSFRSNHVYGEHHLERTMGDCGELIDDVFEPLGGKGAVARATLYFLLRYPGEAGRRYTGDALDTLLRWHAENPVSLWEKHRNATIAEAQGNRNPLIDFPEWARKLGFE